MLQQPTEKLSLYQKSDIYQCSELDDLFNPYRAAISALHSNYIKCALDQAEQQNQLLDREYSQLLKEKEVG